jgi:hypothetical protein
MGKIREISGISAARISLTVERHSTAEEQLSTEILRRAFSIPSVGPYKDKCHMSQTATELLCAISICHSVSQSAGSSSEIQMTLIYRYNYRTVTMVVVFAHL